MRSTTQILMLLALPIAGVAALGQASMSIQMGKPEKAVVGLPFAADQSVRTVQHLANGMAITHQMKGHVYRSADGLERLEGTFPSTDPAKPDPTTMVWIVDRVKHTAVVLNSKLMTATLTHLPADATVSISFLPQQRPQGSAQQLKPENLQTTDLGKRTQDMLPLTGRRIVGTIPAGKIGNDQPILMTTEVWVAAQLKLVVKETELNPLVGERFLELTNIRSEEPDPVLFKVPDGYTVTERDATSPAVKTLKETQPSPSVRAPEQRTKQIEDALNDPSPLIKNNLAYGLAQNGDHLADAETLAEQAVQLQEQQTAATVSQRDTDQSFDQMVSLSRFWDTVGFVYYRAHKPERAETYLRAAWQLNPNSLFAMHLGLAYEAEHKLVDATAIYRMALSAKPSPALLDELTTHLAKLGSANPERSPIDIATPLPALTVYPASGEDEPLVDIVLSHSHPPSVTLLKGDPALRQSLTESIQSALAFSLPDDGPEVVIRRARVTCTPGEVHSCSLHFMHTAEFTAAEEARRSQPLTLPSKPD